MSRRSFLLILILITLGLACSLQNLTAISKLIAVYVSPSSGSGSFSVMVNYTWSAADQDFSINCTSPDPDGYPHTDLIPITQEEGADYNFTISVTKPGSYNVDCVDSLGNSNSAAFTVTGEPGEASTATTVVEFTHATITFNGDQVLFDTPPLGGPTAGWLEGYCWPPQDNQNNGKSHFTVAADGRLEGICSVDSQGIAIQGLLGGRYYQESGDVDFHLSASNTWTPIGDEANGRVAIVEFSGTGKLIGDAASGTARFTVTCTAYGNNECYLDTGFQDLKYTGTIPFTITFLP